MRRQQCVLVRCEGEAQAEGELLTVLARQVTLTERSMKRFYRFFTIGTFLPYTDTVHYCCTNNVPKHALVHLCRDVLETAENSPPC